MDINIRHHEGGCEIGLVLGGKEIYTCTTIDVFECKKTLLEGIEMDIDREIKRQLTQFNYAKDHLK